MRDHNHRHAHGQPTCATHSPHPHPPRPRRHLPRYALLTAAIATTPAAATTQVWQAAPTTPSDWFTPASWTTAVPTSNDTAFINNGGTAQIASGTATTLYLTLGNASTDSGTLSITGGQLSPTFLGKITVGNTGTGAITQSAGKVTLSSSFSPLYLAFAPTSSASYQLTGTGLLAGGAHYVGYGGTASFVQTGGTHSLTGLFEDLYLAYQPTSTASYSLSGTGKLVGTNLASQYIGYGGSATFIQTGGTSSLSGGSLYLAYQPTSTASYSLSGTGQLVSNGGASSQYVGYGGSATFTQTSGTNTGVTYLYLGYNAKSTGTYSLSGSGLLSLGYSGTAYVGYSGAGTFVQSAGTITAPTGYETIYLGYNAGATGSYTLSGGQIAPTVVVGNSGTGTFIQSGGTTTGMTLGQSQGSVATLLLSGGQVGYISTGLSNSATIIQTGGTVTDGVNLACKGSGTASYTLSAGQVNGGVNQGVNVGFYGGTATFNQTGGTVAGTLSIAQGSRSTGSYTLSGASASIRGSDIQMAQLGGVSASFVQNGGSVSLSSGLNITPDSTATGSYTLNAGSFTAGAIIMGYKGSATFAQSGGTVSLGGLRVTNYNSSPTPGSSPSYLLSAGSLTSTSGISLTSATFSQSGGVNTIGNGSPASVLHLIGSPAGPTSYTLSNDAQLLAGTEYIGETAGSSTFTQTGGINDLRGNALRVQYYPNANAANYSGTYLLSDTGQLRAGPEILGFGPDNTNCSGTGLFRQSGGDNQAQSLTINPTGRYELLAGSLTLTGPLTISPGGALDLTAGTLTLAYGSSPSPADSIRQYLLTSAISSSPSDLTHRPAYMDVPAPTLSGEPTAPSSLLVKLALTGDANLDGLLDDTDYALLDFTFSHPLLNAHWTDGDFNYDGLVDTSDFLLADRTLFLQNHGLSDQFLSSRESRFGTTYVADLLASVPEPTPLLSACALALPLLSRRRIKP